MSLLVGLEAHRGGGTILIIAGKNYCSPVIQHPSIVGPPDPLHLKVTILISHCTFNHLI